MSLKIRRSYFNLGIIALVLTSVLSEMTFVSPKALAARAAAGGDVETSDARVSAEAIDKAIDKVISRHRRPSVEEVLKAFSGMPLRSVLARLKKRGGIEDDVGEQLLKNVGPAVIAMEKAFPGAVWAPLGRDSANIGDAIDAFYLLLGQKGRVRRVNLSGASFTGNPKDIVDFFRDSVGYSMSPDAVAAHPPLVLFDNTGYSGAGKDLGQAGSQSNRIMVALYAAYEKAGGRRSDLVHRLNFIANGQRYRQSPKEFLRQRAAELTQKMNQTGQIAPSKLLHVPIYTYGKEWHFNWSQIQKSGKRTVTQPGAPGTDQIKVEILFDVLTVVQGLKKKGAVEAILASAKKQGVDLIANSENLAERLKEFEAEIEKERAAEVEKLKKEAQEFVKNLRASGDELISKMKKETPEASEKEDSDSKEKEERKSYLGENAKEVKKWMVDSIEKLEPYMEVDESLKAAGSNVVTYKAIEMATKAVSAGLISSKDYRRLLAYSIGLSQIEDEKNPAVEAFLKRIVELAKSQEVLGKVLAEKADFFDTIHATAIKENAKKRAVGLENTQTNYKRIRSVLIGK